MPCSTIELLGQLRYNIITMEKIVIKGLKLKGFHGVEKKERENGGEFIFNVFLSFSFPKGDDIHKTIDYLEVIREIERINKTPCFLLETLAKRISSSLSSKFKPKEVYVSIKKPNPPIPYSLEYVGVSLKE